MFTVVRKVVSSVDAVTKYVIADHGMGSFGSNEVSVLRKDTKDVIVLPTQTNCAVGCVFCHLTGTTRPVRNLTDTWLVAAVQFIADQEALGDRDLLISFMGAGEPLLNVDNVLNSINILSDIFPSIRFGIATVLPTKSSFDKVLAWLQSHSSISVKMHLSVHGMDSRAKLVGSRVDASSAIECLQGYSEETQQPIEYHYTLVRGVNDSIAELLVFSAKVRSRATDRATVKFLTLSEIGACLRTETEQATLSSMFPGVTVEFYDPPGRDVGSSCGMFDRSIYMTTP